MEKTAIIRKRNGKWVVLTEDGRTLGTHPTKEKATKQLQAIEISKHSKDKKKKKTASAIDVDALVEIYRYWAQHSDELDPRNVDKFAQESRSVLTDWIRNHEEEPKAVAARLARLERQADRELRKLVKSTAREARVLRQKIKKAQNLK